MKSILQRLNNVTGQIEGVKKMVGKEKDCVMVLTQLKAIKSAIGSVMDAVVEEQFDTCIKSLKDEDKKLLVKIKNYVKSN
jgi:DNA-binding FrmR family transcriptional regulator